MKLELIQKDIFVGPILSAICIDEYTSAFLSYSEEHKYQIVYVSKDKYKTIDLGYSEKYYQLENSPVLFCINHQLGIIKDKNELLLYSHEKNRFTPIKIDKTETLPQRFNLYWKNSISDCSVLPICFNSDGIGHDTRYLALLDLDIINHQAYWKNWITLEAQTFSSHKDKQYPPKIDTVMLQDNELYMFSTGEQLVSINKWGMDYYAFIKTDLMGKVVKTLIDSGDLHTIDQKKRGVNGLLSSSQKYLMLTPVFQNDEWKGKQKIFSLATNEILDITFPRGLGKYPQIIQHSGDIFWVYLREAQSLAMCKEKTPL